VRLQGVLLQCPLVENLIEDNDMGCCGSCGGQDAEKEKEKENEQEQNQETNTAEDKKED